MTESVVFEFIGGPHDGWIVEETTGGPAFTTADGLLRHSEGGKVGAEIWLPTAYALEMLQTHSVDTIEEMSQYGYRFPGHTYQITVRCRRGEATIIRARHIGARE